MEQHYLQRRFISFQQSGSYFCDSGNFSWYVVLTGSFPSICDADEAKLDGRVRLKSTLHTMVHIPSPGNKISVELLCF